MVSYFFECKERALAATIADLTAIVPNGVFKASVNVCVFSTVLFLKAHEDSYTFDAQSAYGGFLSTVTLKFLDWRKCLMQILDNPNLQGFNND